MLETGKASQFLSLLNRGQPFSIISPHPHSLKKKKKAFANKKTNNTSRSMGGKPPGLGNDVEGHQWKEGKGGGTIIASAARPPSLLHLVATVCRLHLLATAHSEPLSHG